MGDGLVFDLDLESIRWSAKCIHDHFGTETNPDVSIFEMAMQLLKGERKLSGLPVLLIIQCETEYYAVNNRLLFVLVMYRDIQKSFNSAPDKMMVTCKLCSSHAPKSDPKPTPGRCLGQVVHKMSRTKQNENKSDPTITPKWSKKCSKKTPHDLGSDGSPGSDASHGLHASSAVHGWVTWLRLPGGSGEGWANHWGGG